MSDPTLIYGNKVPEPHFHQKAPTRIMDHGQVWWCHDCEAAFELQDMWDGWSWTKRTSRWLKKRNIQTP